MENIKFSNCEGVEYEIKWRKPHRSYNADGLCCNPEIKDPKILIDPTLRENRALSVLIEEVTHAFFWDIPEKDARKFAPRLAKIIKKAGWAKRESD
tara:strand:+ start:531 stop:818 length:288 start_codon:yes stop_codon:yes gene_type:complete